MDVEVSDRCYLCVVIRLYEIMKSLSICLFIGPFFKEEKVGTSNKDNMYETYVGLSYFVYTYCMTLFFYLESINLLTFDTEEKNLL